MIPPQASSREPGPVDAPFGSSPGLIGLAWATLGFTVAVILGGAVVRATDSGAGCGESWPRCDGQLIPVSPQGATIIEFVHRLMSASLGIVLFALGISLVVRRLRHSGGGGPGRALSLTGALAVLPVAHRVKTPLERAFGWSIVFFVGEVLIGAALVIFGWVENDASVGRVIAVTVHLLNTFLLLGALALVVHHARNGDRPLLAERSALTPLLIGVGVLLVVGASGALNALADTLFPAETLLEGIRDEFGPTAPLLLQLRVLHPVIAIAGGGAVFLLARAPVLRSPATNHLRMSILAVIGAQFVVGLVNVALLTPLEIQVLHLFMADLLWLLWVFFGAATLDDASSPLRRSAPAASR